MIEPTWLRRAWQDALHFQQLKRFGGLYGIRDEGAIESALERPRNRWVYEESSDLIDLAATLGWGLCRGHGYTDGNKRIGFMAMAVFLDLNGLELEASQPEVVLAMTAVAAGEISEVELVEWLRRSCRRAAAPFHETH